ncbi:arsenate reductase [Gordonia araii NBRC 100433]|uniref:arsenate reductase (glutathione/glutaredoxin) n=1 Tax=Gordonia araii NBRC 100433 TaxID=1073574 RepID=G7H5Y5_9ACTN|nr:arsenate reductase (glutaredoxin) [Gordonia araii]NNG99266.1 arsenate reductase (glutaredoxin) [Gordonia araii NBRC 100433]GAB11307.1 arsenate reductase [Gordonia araii NBRC 100433]
MATVYHNPRCSTSRKTLDKLREAGIEPTVVKYLDEGWTREQLVKLFADAGLTPGQAARKREALYKELNLAEASDDEILDAMVEQPVLVERPFVVTGKGTRLARPIDSVDEIL